MTATSTLLAALIAASTTTNGVITVGDTQPFDQVRLYQNPANATVLTNQSSDGSIDTSTTALVITGSTAPTGLVFQPNLSVLRNVTSDIKLLVDTSVELTLNVNIAGTLTAMTVEAGKTAVLTLALIAGIPMIVGSHGFFPVATDGNGAGTGLRFIPTAADESADGDYQVFSKNATPHPVFGAEGFSADLGTALVDLSDAFVTVFIKVPEITADGQFLALSFAQTDVQNLQNASQAFFQIERVNGSNSFVLKVLQENNDLLYSRTLPNFTAGDEITLYFHPRHVRAVSAYGESWIDLSEVEAAALWSGDQFNVLAACMTAYLPSASYTVKAQVKPLSQLPTLPFIT